MGGMHILNREVDPRTQHSWFHYYLAPASSRWQRFRVPARLPALLSARGKLVNLPTMRAIGALLPLDRDLVLLIATARGGFEDWQLVARVPDAGSVEASGDVRKGIKGMEVLVDVSGACHEWCDCPLKSSESGRKETASSRYWWVRRNRGLRGK